MKSEKTEAEKRFHRAMEELKKTREELRAKMSALGKDAGDVLKDAEDLRKLVEAKLVEIGEAAVKEAQSVVAFVHDKLQKMAPPHEEKPAPPPPK